MMDIINTDKLPDGCTSIQQSNGIIKNIAPNGSEWTDKLYDDTYICLTPKNMCVDLNNINIVNKIYNRYNYFDNNPFGFIGDYDLVDTNTNYHLNKIGKSNVDYMHGKYGISPVIGCSHGCVYCYMKDIALKFKNHKDINGEQIFNTYTDWCKPIMVSNYWELVHKLIDHLHKTNNHDDVMLSFSTDPFQYKYPEVITRSLQTIELLNRNNITCRILTKGILPACLINYSKSNKYGITLITMNDNFRKQLEPHASSIYNRIGALRYLHDNGCYTWVSIEPFLPIEFYNNDENLFFSALNEILYNINFVNEIIFGGLCVHNVSNSMYNNDINKRLYKEAADIIRRFCESTDKKFWIRKDTGNNNF